MENCCEGKETASFDNIKGEETEPNTPLDDYQPDPTTEKQDSESAPANDGQHSAGMTNREVMDQLPCGYRMPKPPMCSDNMYDIITKMLG